MKFYDFEGQTVRIVDHEGNPWFAANDASKILGLQNPRQNIQSFPKDEKGVCDIYTPGGTQKLVVISEAGLYRLIFKSRKPAAERFKTWVYNQVLPSIRKTGAYFEAPKTKIEMLAEMANLMVEQERRLLEQEKRIEKIEQRHQEAEQSLQIVEHSAFEPREKPIRAKVNALVRGCCIAAGLKFPDVWNKIYSEFRARYKTDLKRRAENRRLKVKGNSGIRPIDIAEELGLMQELFSVASFVCKNLNGGKS